MPGAKHAHKPVEQAGHEPGRGVVPFKGDCEGGGEAEAEGVHPTLIGRPWWGVAKRRTEM